MVMQNLGGQTKSIMVFSDVAYRANKTKTKWKQRFPIETVLCKGEIMVVIIILRLLVVKTAIIRFSGLVTEPPFPQNLHSW